MSLLQVGLVGWRGMVGSVLRQRMQQEHDFDHFTTHFFSSSQAGSLAPDIGQGVQHLQDAMDIKALAKMDIVVSCQGSAYTEQVHAPLRASGWKGYWIDAAAALRMKESSVIILDPVNDDVIRKGLKEGVRDFIGGNCTVTLMLMAVGKLFQRELVAWANVSTYQAASGAGAAALTELLVQMQQTGEKIAELGIEKEPLSLVKELGAFLQTVPSTELKGPLAGSLLPWIDVLHSQGRTKEEWKGVAETNKILGKTGEEIPIESCCVRVPAFRAHSQSILLGLKEKLSLQEVEGLIRESEWVRFVANEREVTLRELNPLACSGSLKVHVGRLREGALPNSIALFTSGDQLLWGAAEPLRRMLRMLVERAA